MGLKELFAGGEILAAEGSIQDAYSTGRGPIVLRGKSFIEDDESQPKKGSKLVASGKTIIVISELPFQTVKSRLVAHIAELVNQGTLPGGQFSYWIFVRHPQQ